LRPLQRVNVAALQVFDELRFERLGVGKVGDADRDSRGLEHIRQERDARRKLIMIGSRTTFRSNSQMAAAFVLVKDWGLSA
jgi:hypothetical protein